MSNLTEEQREIVSHFVGITGADRDTVSLPSIKVFVPLLTTSLGRADTSTY